MKPLSWRALRQRKLVQWALAYLAGAWVVFQLTAELSTQFGWPEAFGRGVAILLAFGFLVTLVLAWYHGEKGRQRVSGPELLMVAGILLIAGVAITLLGPESVSEPQPNAAREVVSDGAARIPSASRGTQADSLRSRSIAVLPLDNYSPDPQHAYFAEAITEQITTALSHVPELLVVSRQSASQFETSGRPVREFVLEDLRVAHWLEGSAQREGDEARITVQLIDARTGEHVWTETYTVEVIDVLEVQVEIAREVADRLATSFTERDRERILAGSTDDPVAYDLFLQHDQGGPIGTLEALDRRIEILSEAVDRDASFVLAWVNLGLYLNIKYVRTSDPALADSARAAIDHALAAAEDPSLLASSQALRILLFGSETDSAVAILRRAVRENPADLQSAWLLMTTLHSEGDLSEAVEWGRRLIALDPLGSTPRAALGAFYLDLGLDAAAIRSYARAIELGDPFAWRGIVEVHLLRGEFEEAFAAVDSLRASSDPAALYWEGEVSLWAGEIVRADSLLRRAMDSESHRVETWELPTVAYVWRLHGDSVASEELLDRTERTFDTARSGPGRLAILQVMAMRGDTRPTLEALREYVEGGGRSARWIRGSPLFARHREDPEFAAELRRLEEIVGRQRRQVARGLQDDDR